MQNVTRAFRCLKHTTNTVCILSLKGRAKIAKKNRFQYNSVQVKEKCSLTGGHAVSRTVYHDANLEHHYVLRVRVHIRTHYLSKPLLLLLARQKI